MEDLLKRYGGVANLKKHLNFFYKNVCEVKKIKHYFFGINVDNVINDVVNYRSFILRKPEHLYRDYPAQTSPTGIKVSIPVFEDVVKVLQIQMQTAMAVNWRDVPRFSHQVMDIVEETRCKSMDADVPMVIKPNLVTLDAIDAVLKDKKRQARTAKQENGDLKIERLQKPLVRSFPSLTFPSRKMKVVSI